MRLMLGVGESVMIPACSKILGIHLPERHRGFANGVLQGAWSFGPAVGTLGAGLLMARLWLATRIHRHRTDKRGLGSRLDQMDATWRSDGALRRCCPWFC